MPQENNSPPNAPEPEVKSSTEEPVVELANEQDFQPMVKMPKWLRYLLMFLPAGIVAGIVITIDKTVGFPETIFPTAILALTGLSLFFLVVLGDMVYRNVFVYRMLRQESKKARVYKELIKEREERRRAHSKYELEEEVDEYEYDEDEEETEEAEEIVEPEEEYLYDLEEEERPSYRIKSYVVRGGLLSILIANSVVLLILAAILQFSLYGGFVVPTNSTTTMFWLY